MANIVKMRKSSSSTLANCGIARDNVWKIAWDVANMREVSHAVFIITRTKSDVKTQARAAVTCGAATLSKITHARTNQT
eukprot:1923022-Rhodomonas_salina.1